jgi:putative NIF3 family GTP cyclohydrolase 1 type 2
MYEIVVNYLNTQITFYKIMKALQLYGQLERDFINPCLSDDWTQQINSVSDYITDNFKQRSMGLVCDFAQDITKVYTAVFPSKKVMQKILGDETKNAMLFVHHPCIWDIRKAPEVFQQMDRDLLEQFKKRRISIYNLHVPLDNFSDYSTSVNLAKALGIEPYKPFAKYFGSLCAVFGKADLETVEELRKRFEDVVGHKMSLYKYGDNKIKSRTIAVAAGGGNDITVLEDIARAGVNAFITGITVKNEISRKAHEFAEKNRINVLGGTHYSTEKFACIKMCEYFENLGLPSEFIEDDPVMEDL